MSLKEDYEKWADRYPSGVAYALKHNQSYFEVWQAGIKYIMSRPTTTMENGTLDKAAMRKDNPETLVDRLNGIYNVPGVAGQYKPSLINLEAAREIERLRGQLAALMTEFREYKGYELKWRDDAKPASDDDMKIYNELAANYFKDVKGE